MAVVAVVTHGKGGSDGGTTVGCVEIREAVMSVQFAHLQM